MIRTIFVMCLILLSTTVFAEDYLGGKQLKTEEWSTKKDMTVEEKAVFEKIMLPTASKKDKETATNICIEKCPMCFDGRECDYKCVSQKCFR